MGLAFDFIPGKVLYAAISCLTKEEEFIVELPNAEDWILK